MKRAGKGAWLLGVLTLVALLPGPPLAPQGRLLAAFQDSAAHPPDAPPAGPPMPGEPVLVRPKPPQPPADFEQAPSDAKARRKTLDAVQAQKDAQELAALAKQVQGEVGQLSKNVLPKDLDRELKQIQKLAKRLRGEISP